MDLIIVPFHDYKKWLNEGFRTRDAHLAQHFENDPRIGKILVVNRPSSIAEILVKRNSWKTPSNEIVYQTRYVQLAKMSQKTWCLDILTTDFLKVARQKKAWWFTAFNYDKVINEINRAIDFLQMQIVCLFLQNPMAIGAAERLKKDLFVFDAIDNWLYHPQMQDKELIARNYSYVDENADLIFTVSDALRKTFPTNQDVHWIPNGVDMSFFTAAWKDSSIHANQANSKKVIGYVGKIQDRVDFDLVEECVKSFPQCEFYFLGPVYAQRDRINELKSGYSNIFFTGDIHYNMLPQKMKDFDLTIIPHKVDKFTESMNPLKLYEYLAAGKPVVTTGVAGVGTISGYVYVAENTGAFIENIKAVLTQIDKGLISVHDVVDSVPNECSWDKRTAQILDLIEERTSIR